MKKPLKRADARAAGETGVSLYKLILSYDGTDFKGWQRQPKERTIQGELEDAISRIARKRIIVHGAGRTDAGVHAEGQAAHFKAALSLKDKDLFRALNALLPGEIRIISLERVQPGFHARKSALSKTYRYRIVRSRQISPFLLRYALHYPFPLDVRAMKKAAGIFVREEDFSAFSSNRDLRPVRKVFLSRLQQKKDEIVYTVKANGFLRYMARTIVGTLLEVGRGKIGPERIEDLFQSKTRALFSPTAPAKGLCLVKVSYPRRKKAP